MEVAAASFSTWIDSTSFGFSIPRTLCPVSPSNDFPTDELWTGIPSIIQRGSVWEDMELIPRTFTCCGAPGIPEPEFT